MSFQTLFDFEQRLAEYTGAPYVVVTDGCTHALELCFRYEHVASCEFTAFTYLSVVQLMRQLGIYYKLRTEYWIGEYRFHGTRIWDSARLLQPGMYRPGQLQCVSFGHGKPLQLGRVGAILLDNKAEYKMFSRMRSDGRDLRITPWENQESFSDGYHYCPTLEDCARGIELLPDVDPEPKQYHYPDLRQIEIQ
jgi:dTDP-4-amino-4,6-dideoxygalactose transaminase